MPGAVVGGGRWGPLLGAVARGGEKMAAAEGLRGGKGREGTGPDRTGPAQYFSPFPQVFFFFLLFSMLPVEHPAIREKVYSKDDRLLTLLKDVYVESRDLPGQVSTARCWRHASLSVVVFKFSANPARLMLFKTNEHFFNMFFQEKTLS